MGLQNHNQLARGLSACCVPLPIRIKTFIHNYSFRQSIFTKNSLFEDNFKCHIIDKTLKIHLQQGLKIFKCVLYETVKECFNKTLKIYDKIVKLRLLFSVTLSCSKKFPQTRLHKQKCLFLSVLGVGMSKIKSILSTPWSWIFQLSKLWEIELQCEQRGIK